MLSVFYPWKKMEMDGLFFHENLGAHPYLKIMKDVGCCTMFVSMAMNNVISYTYWWGFMLRYAGKTYLVFKPCPSV